jgi:hypothetical protein
MGCEALAAAHTLYVHASHAESYTTAKSKSVAFSTSTPARIICVNGAAIPPTALAETASITSTSTIQLSGNMYLYGIVITPGSSGDWNSTSDAVMLMEKCTHNVPSGGYIVYGYSSSQRNKNYTTLKDCTVHLGSATSKIFPTGRLLEIDNLTLTGSTPSGQLFQDFGINAECVVRVKNTDLSALDYIFEGNYSQSSAIGLVLTNCKTKVGAVKASLGNTPLATASIYSSSSGANAQVYETVGRAGATLTETTHTRTGGASDGTTPYSYRIDTTEAAAPGFGLRTDVESAPLSKRNALTGSALTATIEINSAAGGLTNEDIWFELEYLGDATSPKGSTVSCRKGLLATAAAHASSSASWPSGTAQKMTVTFTPQLTGFVTARVYVAKASSTIYIDPKITLAAA